MSVSTVPATEFVRNFVRYREEAIAAKVINVTSHGRVIGAYLSASEAAEYGAAHIVPRDWYKLFLDDLPQAIALGV